MKANYTILYIDDDDDDLMIIADAFERYTTNLRIIHAHNGFEGLQLLKEMAEDKKLPCLIILDINMPVMDGKQTLIEIRKNSDYNDIPMALFSTSSHPADRNFAEALHADFFTKPSNYENVKNLVKEFVEKCQLEAIMK